MPKNLKSNFLIHQLYIYLIICCERPEEIYFLYMKIYILYDNKLQVHDFQIVSANPPIRFARAIMEFILQA